MTIHQMSADALYQAIVENLDALHTSELFGDTRKQAAVARRVNDLFEELDQRLTLGGELPDVWKGPCSTCGVHFVMHDENTEACDSFAGRSN